MATVEVLYSREEAEQEKEKQTSRVTCIELLVSFLNWKDIRRKTIASLEEITTALEAKKKDTAIAHLTASSAGIVGTILTMVGLILTPITCKYRTTSCAC